ncbi:hypothetical protein PC128_g2077 [Phytophthora cactorum]|nr:hypothetical protein PC128_g2077 [Phytophthora cactorum]
MLIQQDEDAVAMPRGDKLDPEKLKYVRYKHFLTFLIG